VDCAERGHPASASCLSPLFCSTYSQKCDYLARLRPVAKSAPRSLVAIPRALFKSCCGVSVWYRWLSSIAAQILKLGFKKAG
jgi:hypothetical protein